MPSPCSSSQVETQSLTILDKPSAKEALERQRNPLIAGEDVAVSQVEAMDQALNDLINGDFVLGEYHYSLAVLGDTLHALSRNVAKARTQIADAGFQTALIDLVADAAWFAQLPGNWRYRPREAKLTSRNFCGLSSLHNFSTGTREGNPWGEAITIAKTPSGQPLYLNFHVTAEKQDSADARLRAAEPGLSDQYDARSEHHGAWRRPYGRPIRLAFTGPKPFVASGRNGMAAVDSALGRLLGQSS
jgi:type IV secretion system protein VirB4